MYQSRKRGTLESDLLLSTFARDNLDLMSEAELKEYDRVCVCGFFFSCCKTLNESSFWMSQTGIFIIGVLGRGYHLGGGRIRNCWKG